ncbi:SusC/RagA family TonB-linked outer membrane protein [Mucilaginibacter polytrichastri]|uniref:TonB-dependent receptor plug domain-containing protein n=1 Tax=Mucilaginibacter polytrichastri TaxID=1302689 RepID=A0A1Q6A440_9SPHI|nr:SusC/RagA family TonB-linked outer membrane protein [Mucilaginibacter polytrichastri]OKS88770.1 hypothetical protein RG47T_4248 [Mucilaginibacter polytrichastri]SFT05455.1 TonB-linked outer membrane protein, SusC/RagA family [Mucilaginibacter polytrichastri]
MKLTTLLLIIGLLQVSAKSFSQITLNETNAPVIKVLESIRKQSGYDFFYDKKELKDQKISIKVTNSSLSQTLSQCFKSIAFDYQIVEKNVVITAKEDVMPSVKLVTIAADTLNLHLTIIGENNKPLPGATITVKGSDMNFKFVGESLYKVAAGPDGIVDLKGIKKSALIKVSYVGYITKEVKAKANLSTISLEVGNSSLDETHVIGYSSESRRFSVNSTTVITAQEIADQPVTNVLQALDGRVPGLNISSTSGAPGSQVRAQIRGQNTLPVSVTTAGLNNYNQPLFLLDGLPIPAQNTNIAALQSFGGNNGDVPNSGISPINGLNPSDIESVTILKDADATSIYGSQGANGVILITTKKGKAGKTQFNLQVNDQVNTNTRPYQMLNTQQYLQIRQQAYASDKITPTALNAPDLTVYDQNKYTNFAKNFFDRSSSNTDIHASLSGGSDNSTFYTSLGYTNSNYNFPGDYADKRLTLHTAYHYNSVNKKLTVDFGTDLSNDHNNSSASPNIATALSLPPNTPDLTDANGNLIWNYKGVDITNYQIEAYLKQPASLQSFLLNSTFNLGYEILPGLKITLNAGYGRGNTNEYLAFPLGSQSPLITTTSASFAQATNQTIYVEPQITYKRIIGKGVFNALLGGSYKKQFGDQLSQLGTGFSNDALLGSISNAAAITATDNPTIYKYADVFARLGYIYNNKYIISLTGNRDATSDFGPGRQFGNFGSAGLGWIFSEEVGFKKLLPVVSYAKLSANYGTTGTDPGSAYLFHDFAGANPNGLPFQGTSTLYPLNLNNPVFSWATKKALNVALDFGLFNNKLLINTSYYINRTSDQLINATLPIQTGFNTVYENQNATVQDKGLEITITSTNIRTQNFSWTTSFQISGNRNKLVAFPGLATSPYASQITIGLPTTEIYAYQYKGVDPATGIFQFYGADGKTVVQYPNPSLAAQGGDKVPLGDLAPRFQGGFGNTFKYKNLSLSIYCSFSDQNLAPNYLYGMYSNSVMVPGTERNFPTSILGQYWEKPGDSKPLEKLTSGKGGFFSSFPVTYAASNFINSSGAYSKDFYVRVKTVALSYTLPAEWVKSLHMSNARVFINAENLLTFTGYKFLDPETPGLYYTLPLQRIVSGGLSLDF